MMLLLSALVALSMGSTFRLPGGGSLDLPPGCVAPDVVMGIDSSMGFIRCKEKSTIDFEDSALAPSPCTTPEGVSLQSQSGAPLRVCIRSRADAKGRVEWMLVDLGLGVLRMEIKSSQDVLLLLKIASSLRLDRKQ